MPLLSASLRFVGTVSAAARAALAALIEHTDVDLQAPAAEAGGLLIVAFDRPDAGVLDELKRLSRDSTTLAVSMARKPPAHTEVWAVLDAGAEDLLIWPELPTDAGAISCRLQRWQAVHEIVDSPAVRARVAGSSPAWRSLLRGVVEAAHFSQASVLISGETGTGKEQIAHLIHELDPRTPRGDFVVLDCTTVAPELSGSEFFGHERGAYTGATQPRDGAFALAHRGTLFLDEIGELSLPLQAQLLRVVQERQYKRLGSNSWQHSDFRLVCATHRKLETAVAEGRFRADLYYRIAGWRCTTPPLAQRREDILPLARFFLGQLDSRAARIELDGAVRDYLLTRDYPGNARDLRQVVTRLWQRHPGVGPLTAGAVPADERPQCRELRAVWPDDELEAAIGHAVELGVGLKEIGQVATELATRCALLREGGNLQRAAARLGVTDRALQIRQAQRRAAR